MMKPENDVALLTGEWLARLKASISDNDYCPVCDHHPSQSHAAQCPLNPTTITEARTRPYPDASMSTKAVGIWR